MSKKRQLEYFREKIMCDVQEVNLLLSIIASYRVETLDEAVVLADVALSRTKSIGKNNERIGEILMN